MKKLKKLLTITLVISMVMSLCTFVRAAEGTGTGTEDDPIIDTTVAVILPSDGVSAFTQQIPVGTDATASAVFGTLTGEAIESATVVVSGGFAKVTIVPKEATLQNDQSLSGEVVLTYSAGTTEPTHQRTYSVTTKPVTKSVQWIKEGETAQIIISSTQTKETAVGTPDVLVLGSMCTRHGLKADTVKQTLNSISTVANVDYFFYAKNSSLSTTEYTASGSLTCNPSRNINATITPTSGSFKYDTGYHVSHVEFAKKIIEYANTPTGTAEKPSNKLDDYDLIVLEFDGFRMGKIDKTAQQVSTALLNQDANGDDNKNYDDVVYVLMQAANLLKEKYDQNKIAWLVPDPDEDGQTVDDAYYMYEDKAVISSSSGSSNKYNRFEFDTFALIDPEDWLDYYAEAAAKPENAGKTLTELVTDDDLRAAGTSSTTATDSYEKTGNSFFQDNFPNFEEMCREQKYDNDTKQGMWAIYGSTDGVLQMIDTKNRVLTHYQKISIKDVMESGFEIESYVPQYYNEGTSKWEDVPEGKYTIKTDPSDKDQVSIEFNTGLTGLNLDKELVRLVINITAGKDIEYSGSGTSATAKTNKDAEITTDDDPQHEDSPELPVPSLMVEKSINVGDGKSISIGDEVIYTVKVKNLGAVDLNGVMLTDILGGRDVTGQLVWDGEAGSGGSIGTLEAGKSFTLAMAYTVAEGDLDSDGWLVNTAYATANDPNDTGTITSNIATVENPVPSMTVTKTVTNSPATPVEVGTEINYAVTVTNTGSVEIKGVTLTDAFFSKAKSGTLSMTIDGGTATAPEVTDNTVTIGDLAAGKSAVVTYTYAVIAADIKTGDTYNAVTNVATATGKVEREDPFVDIEVTDEDSTETEAKALPAPALTINKSVCDALGNALSGPFDTGDEIYFKITVTNTGNVNVTGIKVKDELTNGEEKIAFEDLEPSESDSKITKKYTVTEDNVFAGKITNVAEVVEATPAGGTLTKPSTTLDTLTTSVKRELTATKDWSIGGSKPASAKLGDVIDYTITVENTGNVKLSNVQLTDELFSKAVSAPAVKVGSAGRASALAGNVLTISGTLAPNGIATVTYSYKVTEDDIKPSEGKVVNTVSATGEDENGDHSTPEEKTTETVTEVAGPSLAVTKTCEIPDSKPKAEIGDPITYTITVTNNGNVTVTDITLEDAYFSKAEDGTLSMKIGVGTPTTPEVTTDHKIAIGTLAPGETAEVTYKYVVTSLDAVVGKITNNATAKGTSTKGTVEDKSATTETGVVMPLVTVKGTKIWDDSSDAEHLRPTTIEVKLLANGIVDDSKTQNVTEATGWSYIIDELPMYDAAGVVTYTVKETAIERYTTTYTDPDISADGATITIDIKNTHRIAAPEPTKITVSGSKTWKDESDKDGIRPASITINLLADGEVVDSETVTKDDGWKWSFKDLPVKDGSRTISYSISEEAVPGYTATYSGYNVTNTHVPGTVNVSGAKTWDDAGDAEGLRPASITINLLANGVKIDSKTVTAANGWNWAWNGLAKYDGGAEITYTISEEAVSGYTAAYSGYNVTNTHKVGTVTVAGSKTWDDDGDAEGKRPASITVNLYANGTKIASKTVTAASGWSWEWTGLPKYEGGAAISYAINENHVNGYMCSVDGYDLTNTFITPEKKEELPEPIPGKPGAIDWDGDGIISELDDLFDGDVPLGGVDRNGDGVIDELDDMFDEDVPLANVARTRDASVFWYICTIISALGLCIISYEEHKGGKRLMRNKQ